MFVDHYHRLDLKQKVNARRVINLGKKDLHSNRMRESYQQSMPDYANKQIDERENEKSILR